MVLNMKVYILISLFALIGEVKLLAQSGEGGGVWIENEGQLINSLVVDNSAEEGFGIAGGNGVLLNCTVANNRKAKHLRNERIGDILCANGEFVRKENYAIRTVKDAIGVVFWVSSNVNTQKIGMYIVALQEVEKKWGSDAILEKSYSRPMEDTACYTRTNAMVVRGSEAAIWCADFQAEFQSKIGLWAFPAGYQMEMLFLNSKVINEILTYLKGYNDKVQLFEKEMYWCSTESFYSDKAWIINFKCSGLDEWGEPGTFLGKKVLRNEAHGVRPVMVYYK